VSHRCYVCHARQPARFCSDQCRELWERLKKQNLSVGNSRPDPGPPGVYVPEPEAPEGDGANDRPQPLPPAVLYGLLTADDVKELERRRERFQAAGVVLFADEAETNNGGRDDERGEAHAGTMDCDYVRLVG
jgi:hypothetical protein